MDKKGFTVTCLKCKGQAKIVVINNQNILYKDHMPIISSRLRPDMQWGFECVCGNNSLIAPEESKDLDYLIQNTNPEQKKQTIKEIADRLKLKPKNMFSMEKI